MQNFEAVNLIIWQLFIILKKIGNVALEIFRNRNAVYS